MHVGIICGDTLWDYKCDNFCLFLIVLCTAVTLPNFYDLTRIILDYFWQNLVDFFVQNHVCNQFLAQGPPED
jgi:hypothetical protein